MTANNRTSGPTDAVVVTASANAITSARAKSATPYGVYLGTSGNVTFTLADGASVEFQNMAAGLSHAIQFTHITATSATGVIALFN